ncbi:MAG: potassium transporter TrkG [Syntrophaceticus sp.]|jgi:trk system potassium uptake protein TrkH|nr:potassium transporter TrkG [Syntrophaceticus sp.]MDD4360756.1 potassium transporter TrkG [Syntrophaceticus sp.]MDD4782516.1 potassium transporter TrkG [Syntrophaceticus sp.]HBG21730.1 potassium transporter [Peptococcaceae bacterium]HBI26708.1 potassium transporter [Peptococcaceae bacterium]
MNIRLVVNLMGKALIFLGLAMLFPLLWAVYDQGPDKMAFLYSIIITLISGIIMILAVPQRGEIRYREGFAIVTVGWLLVSLYGCLPYLLSGVCTNFPDAFFESMSGFTTTGASIFADAEALPRGILFWRSLTQWLGGMGIIVFLVALLSHLGVGANRIFRAEIPGLKVKFLPRISETAQVLWLIYLVMSVLEAAILCFLGMPLFDSLCHTFGTMATGGFNIKNASIGYYDQVSIHWVITIFMFLAGANFALYFLALYRRSLKVFWKNEEFRFYLVVVVSAIVLVVLNNISHFNGIEETIRASAFQVVSIITTTGYTNTDFSMWPYMSQAVLLIILFIGGCSGSTSGSIKAGRILILLKQAVLEIKKLVHPRAVFSLKIGGKQVPADTISNVTQFFFLYIAIVAVSCVVMTAFGFDLMTAFNYVAASITNLGLAGDFSVIPDAGKLYLNFLMLLGRLEIYTVFVMFSPSFWK